MTKSPKPLVPILLGVLAFGVGVLCVLHSPTLAVVALAVSGALKLTPEECADFEERLRYAVRDLGFCNAARWLGMDCGDLLRVLKNEGRQAFDARRIEWLPLKERQRWYWTGVTRHGLPAESRRYLKMALEINTDDKEIA